VSLRQLLGEDARRVHEQVDEVLDSDDALIVLFDGERAVNYAAGFALSGSQLELLAVDIERLARGVTGARARRKGKDTRDKDTSVNSGAAQHCGSRQRMRRSRMADRRSQGDRFRDHSAGADRIGTGRVLRMATQVAAPNPGRG
jgi:hypothetical protein